MKGVSLMAKKLIQRIPFSSQKIAKNVNGDEAAVLGAAFRGASLSNQFRLTKDISIKDIIAYPIQVAYQPEIEGKEAPAVHTVLFKQFGALGTRKIMTFKRESDFDFDISYGGDELGDIAKVKITGLTAALEKHAEDIKSTEHPPKVRITMEMSDSGIVSVPEAALHVSKASFTGKKKKMT